MAGERAKKAMREWVVPDDIYERHADFRIASEIRALAVSPRPTLTARWRSRVGNDDQAIAFGRRALDVAIHRAKGETQEDLTDVIADWANVSEKAGAAHQALRKLNECLRGQDLTGEVLPEQIESAIRTAKVLPDDSQSRLALAMERARELISATEFSKQLAETARRQAAGLKKIWDGRGDKPFQAFAVTLGEAWFCLTEQPPSASSNAAENPFVRFLHAAWLDAGGTLYDPDQSNSLTTFVSGARHARAALTDTTGKLLPDLQRLALQGGPIQHWFIWI